MPLRASYFKRVFQFNFKARTSRGLMRDKVSWFIKLHHAGDDEVYGLGECGPLPGLSIDARPDFEERLAEIVSRFNEARFESFRAEDVLKVVPPEFPSIIFGFETAAYDLVNGGKRVIFKNHFLEGYRIPINGLIWMGDIDFMMGQISIKVSEGFRCIKLKVGGLDFDRECDVLNYIRKRYFRDNVILRLDANGAFKLDDVLYKLEELSKFTIHSIEQPIKPGLPEMEELCRKSPIPIALDEELIGKTTDEEKASLLQRLKPQYIILKPTLHGGLQGCASWINIAAQNNIGWWVTSALESSVGLNAICQFTANYNIETPQGLGTGGIYDNNIESPLEVKNGEIYWNAKEKWNLEEIAESF
ncbi:o-succinylbenzoate synthase [Fulvivirgaceae bacterium PWU4]|uniref:O-succinylbenzoate synthase n=1 Tax=Chryseosolibacter histidini TaxID=2782349 RepID=A0AAP2DJK1_9BACT|nr:o-succinylbenzoate synthase [Chryseosolibacter histidini]MBT1697475.1 o-succinylbenzoate synthase [Chryseosolibacter histidini]